MWNLKFRRLSHGAAWPLVAGLTLAVSMGTAEAADPANAGVGAASKAAAKPQPKGSAAAQARGFTIEAVPAWVKPVVADPAATMDNAPVQFLMRDFQTRISERGEVQRYLRSLRQITETAGLEQGAQIQIDFDPSYQRLVFHRLEVLRGQQRLNRLDPAKVQMLQRETRLEWQMVDGRKTASLVLDDVRVGDKVDLVYSVIGDNPVFNGKFFDQEWSLNSKGPTAQFEYRLLAPAARQIRHRVDPARISVSSSEAAGVRETVFRRLRVPAWSADNLAPASSFLEDQIQFSEFGDWAEVAHWAEQLFAPVWAPDKAVTDLARQIMQDAGPDPLARAQKALDFVQTEVRYFGTEIGENSHLPVAPGKVLAQRYGDCKDKSGLLSALLRAMDIPASPALVSTLYRDDVNTLLPSPLAFNHAIAQVTLNGKPLWLDATRSHQKGPVLQRESLGLGHALLVAPATQGLTPLPGLQEALRVSVVDTFVVDRIAAPVQLVSRITYVGDYAESARSFFAQTPVAELQKSFVGDYLRAYPMATPVGELQLEEQAANNAVTVTQRYQLTEFWRFPEEKSLIGEFGFMSLADPLRVTERSARTRPVQINSVGLFRHTVRFEFAEPVFGKPSSSRVDDRQKAYELRFRQNGDAHTQEVEAELQMRNGRIAAADWAAHLEQVTKSFVRLGQTIQFAAIDAKGLDHLRDQLRVLDRRLQSGELKVASRDMADAHFKRLVLNAQLDSGRLSPKLRGQALMQRGIQQDHLGQPDLGLQDFQAALALMPDSAPLRASLAVNALSRRQDADALRLSTEALALGGADDGARYTQAYALYFMDRPADARARFREILESRTEQERSYGAIWLYLSARKAGDDGKRSTDTLLPTGRDPGWPLAVLNYLRGEATMDTALVAARLDGRPDPGRLCELYYYAGQKALLDGDKAQARQWLRKAVDTGVRGFNEFNFAQRALDAL